MLGKIYYTATYIERMIKETYGDYLYFFLDFVYNQTLLCYLLRCSHFYFYKKEYRSHFGFTFIPEYLLISTRIHSKKQNT